MEDMAAVESPYPIFDQMFRIEYRGAVGTDVRIKIYFYAPLGIFNTVIAHLVVQKMELGILEYKKAFDSAL